MAPNNQESIAQLADTFLLRTAIGVGLLAIAYAMSASMYLVSDDIARIMDKAEMLLGLIAVVVILPVFVRYGWLRMNHRANCADADGYISGVFNKACVKAFSLTFVFLIILEPVTEKYFKDLPTDFFINSILSLSLTVFSVSFFYRILRDRDEFGDDL